MSATATASKTNTITLRGSAQLVSEFFGYSINSILYMRGIYDPDSFTVVKKYGMKLHVSSDEGLATYLKKILKQMTEWLSEGSVKKLVLVITDSKSQEVMERWAFDVSTDKQTLEKGEGKEKDLKEIQSEIAAIIRQISASVTFLPMLDNPCTFDLLVYTNTDTSTPTEWEESDPKYIQKANEVRMRSFTTKIHAVETSVAYRAYDDDE